MLIFAMTSVLGIYLLGIHACAAMAATVDPSFEPFQDDLLVMVDKFYKSETEVAFLVSFLNPTEHKVKSSSPVHKFLPQSTSYPFLHVSSHDPDFTNYRSKVTAKSEFRLRLKPKEQQTYTFSPLSADGRPASEPRLMYHESDLEDDDDGRASSPGEE